MWIICLQLDPALKQVSSNIAKATHLLQTSREVQTLPRPERDPRPIWLLLPELAFTGYNFRDAGDIAPYLEARESGASSLWARDTAKARGWYVTVGYPERAGEGRGGGEGQAREPVAYNSAVTYGPDGVCAAHYRKRFLYYTDETWAAPNPADAFFAGDVGALGRVGMGICMDINPRGFTAPWAAFEFARHVLESRTPVAAVCMAWLTQLSPPELAELPLQPDQGSFGYWMERFAPLREPGAAPVVVACANRCGVEGAACYAGTSAVMSFRDGSIALCGILGRKEEKCLVVDTEKVCSIDFRSVLGR